MTGSALALGTNTGTTVGIRNTQDWVQVPSGSSALMEKKKKSIVRIQPCKLLQRMNRNSH